MASALLLVCEGELVTDASRHRLGTDLPFAVVVGAFAVVTGAVAWRRTAPLASTVITIVGVAVLISSWSDDSMPQTPQLLLLVSPYGVAAFAERRRAVIGLTVCFAALVSAGVVAGGQASGLVAGGACAASWVVGRLTRSRHLTAIELHRTMALIEAERDSRALLAIAEERTRIAHELQALVAQSVSAMIVQAGAAGRLLEMDDEAADVAMATVEATGREALVEMRRILGVLRHPEDAPDLTPQPGIGQIPTLIASARAEKGDVSLEVLGTPGPLPASVDLGVYRVLEDALSGLDATADDKVTVILRFEDEHVAMEVASLTPHLGWPTLAMRERAALCRGDVAVRLVDEGGECLSLRMPRTFEEVSAWQ